MKPWFFSPLFLSEGFFVMQIAGIANITNKELLITDSIKSDHFTFSRLGLLTAPVFVYEYGFRSPAAVLLAD